MAEEQVILVNEKDEQIGLCPKMKAHEEALLHRAFSVFIFNDEGKLLLQQRASEKYHSPKLWTNTVCSHQRNSESNIQAGKRRMMEEMGMTAELKEVFHFIYQAPFDNGLTEHELDHVMIGFSNKNPIINPDEVMSYKWKTLEDIQADIKLHPENYTEWFKIIFDNSFDKLQAELVHKMLKQPLFFDPIYKEKPWGGNKLKSVLHKNISSDKTGESWEISDYDNDKSVVNSGYFRNKTLSNLIEQFEEKILGQKIFEAFGKHFPLLIKYIDAAEDLSIQVHPNDKTAKKYHNSNGKNELWHIIQADDNAYLYIGFQEGTTKNDYLSALKNNNLEQILNRIQVKKNDTFYIAAGTVHSIGKGVLLAEVQQSSDLTYRIYDWNRLGLDGKTRDLHTEKALEAIDFKAISNPIDEKHIVLPNFTIDKINITDDVSLDLSHIDSFVILMNISNNDIVIQNKIFKKGQTVLIPAICQDILLSGQKESELLMIYI
jgi:mannose-6-phosphate isomerase